MRSLYIALVWIRLNLLGPILVFLLFAGTLGSVAMVSERHSTAYSSLVLQEHEKLNRSTAQINRTTFFLNGSPEPIFGIGLDRLLSYLKTVSEISNIETQLVSIHPYLFFHGYVRGYNGKDMKLEFLVMDDVDFSDFTELVGIHSDQPVGIGIEGRFNFLNEEGVAFRQLQVSSNVSNIDLEKRDETRWINNVDIAISRSFALAFLENYTGSIDFQGYVFMDYNLSSISRSQLDDEIKHFQKFSNVDFTIQIGGENLFIGKTTDTYVRVLKNIRSEITQLEIGGFLLLLPVVTGLFFLYLVSFWTMIATVREEVYKLKKSGISTRKLLGAIGSYHGLVLVSQIAVSWNFRSVLEFIWTIAFVSVQFILASFLTFQDTPAHKASGWFQQKWIPSIKMFFGIGGGLLLLTQILGIFFENFEKFNPLVGNSNFFISFLQIGVKVGSFVALVTGIAVLVGFLLFRGSMAATCLPKGKIRVRYVSFSILGSRLSLFFMVLFVIPNILVLIQAIGVDAYYSDQAIMRVGADYMWTPWTNNISVAEAIPEGNYIYVAIYDVMTLNFGTIEMMVIHDPISMPNVMRFPQQMDLKIQSVAQQLSEGKTLVGSEFKNYIDSTGKFVVQFQYNETVSNSFIIWQIDTGSVFTYFPTFRHLESKKGASMIVSSALFQDMIISKGIIHTKMTEYVLLNKPGYLAFRESGLINKGRLDSFEVEKKKMMPLFLYYIFQLRHIIISFLLTVVVTVSLANLRTFRTLIYDYAKLKILKILEGRSIMVDLGGTWLVLSNYVLLASFLSVSMLLSDFKLDFVEYTLPMSQIDQVIRTATIKVFAIFGLLINLIAIGKIVVLEYLFQRISNLKEDFR